MEHKLNIELLDTEMMKLRQIINEAKELLDYYTKSLEVLKSFKIGVELPNNFTFTDKLLRQIIEINGIELDEIYSNSREYKYTNTRIALSNYLYRFNCSKSAIAKTLNQHHTTILRNIEVHDDRMKYHKDYYEIFSKLVENENRLLQYLEDNYYYQLENQKKIVI